MQKLSANRVPEAEAGGEFVVTLNAKDEGVLRVALAVGEHCAGVVTTATRTAAEEGAPREVGPEIVAVEAWNRELASELRRQRYRTVLRHLVGSFVDCLCLVHNKIRFHDG